MIWAFYYNRRCSQRTIIRVGPRAMDVHRTDVKYSSVAINDQSQTSRRFLYLSTCAANLATFACGLALGWSSPMLPKLNGSVEPRRNPLPVHLTLDEESWMGSLLALGAIFGPIVAGSLMNRIGRKKMLLISTAPLAVSFYVMSCVNNVYWYFAMRFLSGLALGGVYTVLPIYLVEISDSSVRGTLVSLIGPFLCFGILVAYAVGPYVSVTVFNALCSVVPTIFLPLFFVYVPDSPHYLVKANCEVNAEEALMKFRGKSRDAVQKELLEIKDDVKASGMSFMDFFYDRGLNRALLLSVGLVTFQQLSGINVVLFYNQTIFAAAHSSISPEVCTIAIGTIQLLSTFFASTLVDRTGKRFLLLVSAAGMVISQASLGGYFYAKNHGDVDSLTWLPVLSLVSYMITYNVGFGSIPFAVMGELFPTNTKAISCTITTSVCWSLAFVITKFFSDVAALVGIASSFWIFSGCCAFAFPFVFWLLPETSGKSLQEIQDVLNR